MIARLTQFPSYRSRYLPALTPAAIAALADKHHAPVILTTGAIEQHGPHLPVAVDAFLGQVWISRLVERLVSTTPCYIAPPITIGKSNEHTGYPGTLIISRDLLRRQVLTIARQVKDWGFRTLRILNTHGGNTSVLAYTLREIRLGLGLNADLLHAPVRLPLDPQEAAYGFHANQFETAALLALAPEHTHLEAAVRHYPASLEDPGELRPEGAPATFAWASQDLSPSGIMGDAPAATAADGHAWVALIADAIAAEVTRLATASAADPTAAAR